MNSVCIMIHGCRVPERCIGVMKVRLHTHTVGCDPVVLALLLGHFVKDWCLLFEPSCSHKNRQLFQPDPNVAKAWPRRDRVQAKRWGVTRYFVSHTFIAEGVQSVDHELEDAVSHQRVVKGGTAAFPLQSGPGLPHTKNTQKIGFIANMTSFIHTHLSHGFTHTTKTDKTLFSFKISVLALYLGKTGLVFNHCRTFTSIKRLLDELVGLWTFQTHR